MLDVVETLVGLVTLLAIPLSVAAGVMGYRKSWHNARRFARLTFLAIGCETLRIALALWRGFVEVAVAEPAQKSVALARAISDGMFVTALAVAIDLIPALIAGAVLMKARRRFRPLPAQGPQGAPHGAMCAAHPAQGAIATCHRCGDYACETCMQDQQARCVTCAGIGR